MLPPLTPDEAEKTRVCERNIWAQALQMPSSKGRPLLALFSLLALVCKEAFRRAIQPELLWDSVADLYDEWLAEKDSGSGRPSDS